ncbi:hypothetical protein R1sor_014032 [Riccia sorocarpa]|uniref:Reverse transcriptase domain-containing protein n=1 Tax=Riccia sorocarpa TaxID=122646 RepID=A0ABD3H886_9MARC
MESPGSGPTELIRDIPNARGSGQENIERSEDQLVTALRKVSLEKGTTSQLRVKISKREGTKTIKKMVDRGIYTFYYKGEPALGPFRSWALNNWGRKFNVQIETVQEAGDRAILTILSSTEEREEILRQLHPPIRGCHIAHFKWTEEMEDDSFVPTAKPLMVEISKVPLWAKEDLPKVFRKLGQVLQIPQESRELVKRDAKALILWNEGDQLPESILVVMGERKAVCTVRTIKRKITDDDSSDSEVEDGRPLVPDGNDRSQDKTNTSQTLHTFDPTRGPGHESGGKSNGSAQLGGRASQLEVNNVDGGRSLIQARREITATGSILFRGNQGPENHLHARRNVEIGNHAITRQGTETRSSSIETPSWLKDSEDKDDGLTDNEADSRAYQALTAAGRAKTRNKLPKRAPNRPKPNVQRRTLYIFSIYLLLYLPYLRGNSYRLEKLKFFVSTLAPGYTAIASSAVGRKRGVALLFKSEFQLLYSEEDSHGRYAWGHFKFGSEFLHVASVYAPNQAGDRILFWDRLKQDFPSENWFLLGDWNAVVTASDSSSKSNVQAEDEDLLFQELCNRLGTMDARQWAARTEGPKFTRAEFREGKFIWSRIDRIYAPEVHISKVSHHSTFWTSDHIPVTASVSLAPRVYDIAQRPMSGYFKADPLIIQQIFQLLRELSRQQERELNHLIEEVRELQAWKHHRWKLTCRDKFIADGDACTSYFFKRFRKRRARTLLTKLKGDDGQLLTTPADISRKVQDNFTLLYRSKSQEPEEKDAVAEILRDTHQVRSPGQKALLGDLPSERELMESLFLLPSGKSPGPDGMSTDIMRLLWPIIGDTYYSAVVELWSSGVLAPYFKDGLIFLLPKVSDPELIGQWRPIMLLNDIYKVLAKLLAARLALVLPTITPIEQHGFVKGRSPKNCIITFCLVHEALKQQRRSALFFSLDQEKAYDRLCPEFLWSALQHLDFPCTFIKVVKALQQGTESRILLNGHLLPPFLVGRRVRQGCPLSPPVIRHRLHPSYQQD